MTRPSLITTSHLAPARRRLLGNLGAHLGGIYSSKAFDLLILTVVSRKLRMEEVGTYFLADAAGGVVFKLLDFGLYPVLQRRAARNEAGAGLLAWAMTLRSVGVVALTLGFVALTHHEYPDHWFLASAFFFAVGVYEVHEVPRALLAGRERFPVTAKVGVATKALETALTVPCVWFGLGIVPWVVGRLLSQLLQVGFLYRATRRELVGVPSPSARTVLREGIPFWFATVFESTVFRLDMLVVGAYLGLAATAQLGVASRVVGGTLSVVGSLLLVAYPNMARERRRFITKSEATVVLGLSFALGASLFIGAPLVVRFITGRAGAVSIAVVRTLAPVVVLAAIARALEAWLQAKNRERGLAVLTVLTGCASMVTLLVLVPLLGTRGAAATRVFRVSLETSGLALYTYVVLAGIAAPWLWALSLVPGSRGPLHRALGIHTRALARTFAGVPGVVHVALGGSAQRTGRERFRFGRSDLDLEVGLDADVSAQSGAVRACRTVARRRSLFGRPNLLIADAEVLSWARQLGHPLLALPNEMLAGTRVEPEMDPEGLREWGLSHGIEKVARLQRAALEESRHDGGARSAALKKQFRWLLLHLGRGPERLRELQLEGLRLPPEITEERNERLWAPPRDVAGILAVAHRLVATACAEATSSWLEGDLHVRRLSPWLDAPELAAARHLRHLESLPCKTIEISPAGPTIEDVVLVTGIATWTEGEWLSWLLHAAALGPLPLPFRAAPWPMVLPVEALRADAFMEHAPLFHLARGSDGRVVRGETIVARRPPQEFLRRAALRETIGALIRLPSDLAELDSVRSIDGSAPRVGSDHWRFRVRAYAEARLAALSLLLDHGATPANASEVRAEYQARYDDALSQLWTMDDFRSDADRVKRALVGWMEDRKARVWDLLGAEGISSINQ